MSEIISEISVQFRKFSEFLRKKTWLGFKTLFFRRPSQRYWPSFVMPYFAYFHPFSWILIGLGQKSATAFHYEGFVTDFAAAIIVIVLSKKRVTKNVTTATIIMPLFCHLFPAKVQLLNHSNRKKGKKGSAYLVNFRKIYCFVGGVQAELSSQKRG